MEDKTPQNFYLGGGVAGTTLTPAALIILLLAGILILSLRRKYIVIPVLIAIFLLPRGQVLVLGGFHFTPTRMIALMGWLRILWLSRFRRSSILNNLWNPIDKAYFWCEIASACAFVLLWMRMGALFNQVGELSGTLGIYFLLRCLIRDQEDVYLVLKIFAIIAAINGLEMIQEQFRFQNLFGVYVGGIDIIPSVRDGKIRSQGVFGHPILAGTFAATLIPLLIGLWKSGRARWITFIGICGAVLMVYSSASSTPVLTLAAGLLGIFLWPIRRKMRILRWGIVGFLVACQLVMKAPVWFLIARMDVVGASSGYHRAELVDVFIRHFFDWWLVGTREAGTWGWEMFDLSNQYVSRGESGGLVAFILFIALISRSFGQLGNARKSPGKNRKQEWLLWCMGAALFAHVMGFLGVTYWDQTAVAWYGLLAIISATTAPILLQERQSKAVTVLTEQPAEPETVAY